MAIDTAKKRASALGVGLAFITLVVPSGTIAQADRQTIANTYSGILAAAPVVVSPDCFSATQGVIDDQTNFVGIVDLQTNFQGVIELQNNHQGVIEPISSFNGEIDDSVTALNGPIDATTLALQGKLCC